MEYGSKAWVNGDFGSSTNIRQLKSLFKIIDYNIPEMVQFVNEQTVGFGAPEA